MRARVVTFGLLAAVALAVLVPNHPAGRVPGEDAGVFFYIASLILDGGAPYRDVWDHKPPLVYAVDALGLALAGREGVWALQLLALMVAVFAGYVAMTRSFGPRAALVGSIAWLIAVPRLYLDNGRQTSFAELLGLPFQFLILLVVATAPPGRVTPRHVLAGMFAGIAFLAKPTLVAITLAYVAVGAWHARRSPRSALAVPLALAVGAVLVIAIAAIALNTRAALGDAIDQVFRYNAAYASFAPLESRLSAIPQGIRLTLPSGLALVALGAWLYAIVRREGAATPLLAVAVVALPIEMLLSTSGRAYHYYFLAWLPSMAVLVAYAARATERRLPANATTVLFAAVLVLMSFLPTLLVARLTTIGDDGSLRAAASYLAANSRPSDTVFIWGSRTEVLLLADRRAPTRFVYQYAPFYTRGYGELRRIDELLAALTSAPPVLIVDASAGSFVTPPLDRAAFRSWTSPEPQYTVPPETERVIDLVEARYERAGDLPGTGWPVYRLRAP